MNVKMTQETLGDDRETIVTVWVDEDPIAYVRLCCDGADLCIAIGESANDHAVIENVYPEYFTATDSEANDDKL